MKRFALLMAAVALSGCTHTMQLMSRDGGRMYQGEIKESGIGTGTLMIGMGEKTCMGNYAKAPSGDSYGFVQTYGPAGSSFTTKHTSSGVTQYKALLACSDGSNLRCDVAGTAASGTGICVDNSNRVYDMLFSR